MSSGELEVTGKNQVEISLNRRPREAKVWFKDDVCQIPCDVHFDELEWSIEGIETAFGRVHHYELVICWNVSDSRTILWHVEY